MVFYTHEVENDIILKILFTCTQTSHLSLLTKAVQELMEAATSVTMITKGWQPAVTAIGRAGTHSYFSEQGRAAAFKHTVMLTGSLGTRSLMHL